MNGTYRYWHMQEDVNLLGADIRTIERNTDVLLNASRVTLPRFAVAQCGCMDVK